MGGEPKVLSDVQERFKELEKRMDDLRGHL
jgi:hypothetical protein